MSTIVPKAPEFGAPCPVSASPATLELLARRRSSSAQMLTAPGPSDRELEDLLRLAARVPDHGKLAPWRFVVVRAADKPALLTKLRTLAGAQKNPEKAAAALAKLERPPVSVAVISAPRPASIPLWEQELSAGAVCMTLLIAAEAMGWGANWITDWYSYDPAAREMFGVGAEEKIAGFIHLGRPGEPPLERARPVLSPLISSLP